MTSSDNKPLPEAMLTEMYNAIGQASLGHNNFSPSASMNLSASFKVGLKLHCNYELTLNCGLVYLDYH